MKILRERLREADPELHKALEKSWQIATDDWLPTLSPKKDSLNSFPHLRNLERYLDDLICTQERLQGQRALNLSPMEIYVLLSAVLLHDLGNAIDDPAKRHHGLLSAETVRNRGPQLGVASERAGAIIALLCEFHSASPDEQRELRKEMQDTILGNHGPLRVQTLAVLLYLADHLDTTYTRSLPDYICDNTDVEAVGAFRRIVQGVRVDQQAQMAQTVLGSIEPPKNPATIKHDENDGKLITPELLEEKRKERESMVGCELKLSPDNEAAILAELDEFSDAFALKVCPRFSVEECCAILSVARAGKVGKGAWPARTVLAMIMGSTFQNFLDCSQIKEDLLTIGIPVMAWTLDVNGKLFTPLGHETFEPVLNKHYLKEVAGRMWDLSTRVFGTSLFAYEALADELREADVEKVKMAVRRLQRVTMRLERGKIHGAISCGSSMWKWNAIAGNEPAHPHCEFIHLNEVYKKIDLLEELTYGQ